MFQTAIVIGQVRDAEETLEMFRLRHILKQLTYDEFMSRLDELRAMASVRLRAIAAVHWCEVNWPDDDPDVHFDEAMTLFGKRYVN